LQRRVTALQDDSGMVNAELAEMLGPRTKGVAVRHGERQMVQRLVGRRGRRMACIWSRGKHDHDLCIPVPQGDVTDVEIFSQEAKAKHGAIPPSTGPDIRHQELDVREAGDWCARSRFVVQRHLRILAMRLADAPDRIAWGFVRALVAGAPSPGPGRCGGRPRVTGWPRPRRARSGGGIAGTHHRRLPGRRSPAGPRADRARRPRPDGPRLGPTVHRGRHRYRR
jgi:hypothetical protein